MTVIIFKTGLDITDAVDLQNKLVELGLIPKCLEPEESKDPTWRETTNFVHRKISGTWLYPPEIAITKITKEPETEKKPHIHRYFSGNEEVLIESASEPSEIIDVTDEFPLDIHHSFGNGVYLRKNIDYCLAWVVVDPSNKKLALEVIEQIRI